MEYNFCVFILSHSRPNNIQTLETLRKGNYTGKWYIVLDDEDETIDNYIINYGKENILIFNKEYIASKYDTFDNFDENRAVFYARNYCFEAAKELGIDYFVELDDDYKYFAYRKELNGICKEIRCNQLDKAFKIMVEFLIETNDMVKSIAFSQSGDYIGGLDSKIFKEKITRKCMNSFFCKTNNPFEFIGKINEDVNTYTRNAQIGDVFFTIHDIMLKQEKTQKQSGGMSGTYSDNGTYYKSFYSIICCPSAVSISTMGNTQDTKRIHHRVEWEYCSPKIISSKYKKEK